MSTAASWCGERGGSGCASRCPRGGMPFQISLQGNSSGDAPHSASDCGHDGVVAEDAVEGKNGGYEGLRMGRVGTNGGAECGGLGDIGYFNILESGGVDIPMFKR